MIRKLGEQTQPVTIIESKIPLPGFKISTLDHFCPQDTSRQAPRLSTHHESRGTGACRDIFRSPRSNGVKWKIGNQYWSGNGNGTGFVQQPLCCIDYIRIDISDTPSACKGNARQYSE